MAEEGRRDCKPMRWGDLQSCGLKLGGVNRGHGDVQVTGAAAGPVGR